jgi:hypothetical protein
VSFTACLFIDQLLLGIVSIDACRFVEIATK